MPCHASQLYVCWVSFVVVFFFSFLFEALRMDVKTE